MPPASQKYLASRQDALPRLQTAFSNEITGTGDLTTKAALKRIQTATMLARQAAIKASILHLMSPAPRIAPPFPSGCLPAGARIGSDSELAMDVSSVAAAMTGAQVGRTQLAMAAKFMKINADSALRSSR